MTLGHSNLHFVHIGILFLLWSTTVTSSLGSHTKSKVHELYLGAGNNGALQLIIEAYVDSILRDLQNDGGTTSTTKLSKSEVGVIRNRMRGLPHHLISHPAISERRLWIGRNQPHFDPYFWNSLQDSNQETINVDNNLEPNGMEMSKVKNREKKQDSDAFMAEEICATNRTWKIIRHTKDMFGRNVNVVQTPEVQQWIFYYDCAAGSRPCSGISRDYNSNCEMRHGWVNMLHTLAGSEGVGRPAEWGYVETPHHCACKITPKPTRSINCSD